MQRNAEHRCRSGQFRGAAILLVLVVAPSACSLKDLSSLSSGLSASEADAGVMSPEPSGTGGMGSTGNAGASSSTGNGGTDPDPASGVGGTAVDGDGGAGGTRDTSGGTSGTGGGAAPGAGSSDGGGGGRTTSATGDSGGGDGGMSSSTGSGGSGGSSGTGGSGGAPSTGGGGAGGMAGAAGTGGTGGGGGSGGNGGSGGAPEAAFLESGGLLVMEAEHYDGIAASVANSWGLVTSVATASGNQAMASQPDLNNSFTAAGYASTAPRLDFRVVFTQTGTYYVWVRHAAFDAYGDSVHVGLNGMENTTANAITGFANGATGYDYKWDHQLVATPAIATLVVTSAGPATLNLWMREDGVSVDKLLLTTDMSYVPADMGPAESARGN